MKILLALVIGFGLTKNDALLEQIRFDYHDIETSEELESFITKIENGNCVKAEPYLASAIMRRAEFSFWPGSKFEYFNNGKKKLENYISSNPRDVEGRYVRALVQTKIPSFLGYTGNIKSDCNYIKRTLSSSGLSEEYKKLILKNVNSMLEDI